MAQDIIAQLADGTELRFPAGTADDVINKTVQNYSSSTSTYRTTTCSI
jgi:hypothetical protein